jgi:hypothetical protein
VNSTLTYNASECTARSTAASVRTCIIRCRPGYTGTSQTYTCGIGANNVAAFRGSPIRCGVHLAHVLQEYIWKSAVALILLFINYVLAVLCSPLRVRYPVVYHCDDNMYWRSCIQFLLHLSLPRKFANRHSPVPVKWQLVWSRAMLIDRIFIR